MSNYYILGVICGAALVVVIAVIAGILSKKKGVRRGKFDERQIAMQGRAARIALLTLVVCVLINGGLESLGVVWCEPLVGAYACVVIAGLVFVSVCIFGDAYYSSADKPKSLAILFGLIGILNIVISVMHMIDGDFLEDGVVGIGGINLLCGVLLGSIGLMTWIKRILDRREAAEDE